MTQDASSLSGSNSPILQTNNGSSGLSSIVSVSAVKQCIVEPLSPADGGEFIAQAIRNAQQSIWLEVYLLTHSHVIDALVQAAAPDPTTGIKKDIRVILEKMAYPFSASTNTPTSTSSDAASPATPARWFGYRSARRRRVR